MNGQVGLLGLAGVYSLRPAAASRGFTSTSAVERFKSDDGLRLDDGQRRSPSGPDAREQGQEPEVGLRERHSPLPGALQYLQLMP
jgi:hypothetical protein